MVQLSNIESKSQVRNLVNSRPRPKYPLSAYNLFFQYERKRILDGTDSEVMRITPAVVQAISLEHRNKKKRLHRKTHGKIGFADLARKIASAWRRVDQVSRSVLEKQARMEKEQFMIDMRAWREEEEERVVETSAEPPASQQNLPRHNAFKNSLRQVVGQPQEEGGVGQSLRFLQQLRDHVEAEMLRSAAQSVQQDQPPVQQPAVFKEEEGEPQPFAMAQEQLEETLQEQEQPKQLLVLEDDDEVFQFVMPEEDEEAVTTTAQQEPLSYPVVEKEVPSNSLEEWARTTNDSLKEVISCSSLDKLFNDDDLFP